MFSYLNSLHLQSLYGIQELKISLYGEKKTKKPYNKSPRGTVGAGSKLFEQRCFVCKIHLFSNGDVFWSLPTELRENMKVFLYDCVSLLQKHAGSINNCNLMNTIYSFFSGLAHPGPELSNLKHCSAINMIW